MSASAVAAATHPEPQLRLTSQTLPVTWLAAVFALLAGTTMAFVPYEFEAAHFAHVYPHLRPLGLGFLAAGFGLATGAVYPQARLLNGIGRIAFVVSVAVYWWEVSVLPRGMTGLALYPLFAGAVALEAHPRWRQGGAWPPFLVLVGVAFGLILLIHPQGFPAARAPMSPDWVRPSGAAFLAASAVLGLALRKRLPPPRLVLFAFAGLFGLLSYGLTQSRSWVGLELYLVFAGACLLSLVRPRMASRNGVRARLLRAMAVAALVPLFTVGGIASFLAQNEIEDTLRDRMSRTVAAEVEWLRQRFDEARRGLRRLSARDLLVEAVASQEPNAIIRQLERAVAQENDWTGFVLGVRDQAHDIVAAEGTEIPATAMAQLRRTLDDGQARVSPAFKDRLGTPTLAFSQALQPRGADAQAFLVGTYPLDRLEHRTSTTTAYRLMLVDRSDFSVLVDSGDGSALRRLALSADDLSRVASTDPGTLELFDESQHRVLLAHAGVAGTPWVLIASQELSLAFTPVTRISVVVAVLVVLAAALALLLSHLLGAELVSRIAAVKDAAQALAEGDLARRANESHSTPDELATLARVFNRMADRIQDLTGSLKRADRRKDEFLAMVAHELRNPLAALSSAVAIMDVKAAADSNTRELRQVCRRQLGQLVRLVDDLLDVSRITNGKVELRRDVLDLRSVVRDAAETVRPALEDKRHTLSLSLPEHPLLVEGDATRLEQIVSNLMGNAIKYTDPGGRVTVQASGRGSQAVIDVSDTGRGIRADILPFVFDLFVQGDTPIDRREAGLGLGLTLVRSLTTLHGGQVEAHSAGPGQGSTFTLRLPLTNRSLPSTAPAPRALTPSGETGKSIRIVIVDDNEDAALSFKELLESFGHQVDVAFDGESGRDLILRARPHMAFVDLGLPKLDGYDVARATRGGGATTRLFALTGYGGEEVGARARDAGFERHFTKPFRLETLDELLG